MIGVYIYHGLTAAYLRKSHDTYRQLLSNYSGFLKRGYIGDGERSKASALTLQQAAAGQKARQAFEELRLTQPR